MSTSTNTTTGLSLIEDGGRRQLEASLSDFVAFLHRQPAFCGTPEQQQLLIKHVSQGNDLIKLVAEERLKITRELDHQKHEWIELEKQLTAPVEAAMQPLKDAVDHYNREIMRVRQHQLAEAQKQGIVDQADQTDWLAANVDAMEKPKGVRTKWTYKIVDPTLVPNGYWLINEGAIKADIAKGVRSIPGVEIYEEVTTTFRT
ncbi:hypothetical protein [Fibrivirga algicola]|uniref:Uncharacterized protein n=1 Tax=Fibrivirga algicola TaxID=2950420 RepID=A0ABX0QIV5_9BACT|nr:hypothetical protein [Fibrivirga algicola]ARK12504.1 hypothetical protein A6C57_20395 [Fibrella sp. ES10-3-2-2]NID12350.1 hypothetical protein [Fibrivirga algicola]